MIGSKAIKSDASEYEFNEAYEKLNAEERKALHENAEGQVLAIMFLLGGRPEKYGSLLVDLQKQYIRGSNKWSIIPHL